MKLPWLCPFSCLSQTSPPGRQWASASWANAWVGAHLSSSRPLIYKGPQHQPLTSEFPVSLSLPTFQMGKPRPAQKDLATRPTPALDPQSGWFLLAHVASPQPLSPNSWAHPEKPSPTVAPRPTPHTVHDPPNPGRPTKVPSVPHNGFFPGRPPPAGLSIGPRAARPYVW